MDHSEQNLLANKKAQNSRIAFIFLVGISLGYLIVTQAGSVDDLEVIVARDRATDIYEELNLAISRNRDLREEAKDLKLSLSKYSDQASYLEAVENEISRYQSISGEKDVSGPGISIEIDSEGEMLGEVWLIDLVNELVNSGAEAVSVQGVRFVDGNSGFDTLPNSQILFDSKIINFPIKIEAVGPFSEINQGITMANGVIDRLRSVRNDIKVNLAQESLIEIPKVF